MQKAAQATQADLKNYAIFCFDTIIAAANNQQVPKYPSEWKDDAYPIFVTWTFTKDDDLRGCIGTFAPNPLSKILGKYAMISAFQDSRFPPV